MTAAVTHPQTAIPAVARPRVLADLFAGSRSREAALVLAGTAIIILAGRLAIPLPFTPVPISLATFAVIGTGAAFGARRAAASAGLYLVLGVLGAPVFADGRSGWAFASFGYVIGYVVAAVVVGGLAQRGASGRAWTMGACAVVGTALVYVFGVAWMVVSLGIGLSQAVQLGVVPFLVGDALKIMVLAGVIPPAWRRLSRPAATSASVSASVSV